MRNVRSSGGRKSSSGLQGQSPGTGSVGRSPPDAEAYVMSLGVQEIAKFNNFASED